MAREASYGRGVRVARCGVGIGVAGTVAALVAVGGTLVAGAGVR
jgi:hypothetical protein